MEINGMTVNVMNRQNLTDIEAVAIGGGKRLNILPADTYKQFNPDLIRQFGHTHGFYLLPTVELVVWLQNLLGKDIPRTIEIGSGNGSLGRALNIIRTDSYMQDHPEIKAHYTAIGQPTIKYGSDVKKMDALKAVKKYKPKIVIGSWITQVWKPGEDIGNMFGPDEAKILKNCAYYIMIGNTKVHGEKRILNTHGYECLSFPFLVSRASYPDEDRIYIFHGKKAKGNLYGNAESDIN